MDMNRYTYRGRRKNCAWVYGSLIFKNGIPFIVHVDEHMGNVFFAVEPESVGQCVGVADKNKKMIFEGDIYKTEMLCSPDGISSAHNITYWIPAFAEVVFKDGKFQGLLKTKLYKMGKYVFSARKRFEEISSVIEVIGNAFDNPDMMKD